MRAVIAAGLCLLMGGCVSGGQWGSEVHWPSGSNLASAAKEAATAPGTWVPLVAAGALIAADVDHDWSEDLAEDQPLFGDDAEDVSHDLRDIATGAYLVTALLAPSDSITDKGRGLLVGAGTMVADGVLSKYMKTSIGRERPDGSNERSMPSGHASKAASRTAMAMWNLQAMDMPEWSRTASVWALHGVAVGTGLARVEAQKHYLSDVLVGYALGQFVARFMNEAFMTSDAHAPRISFAPVERGGAFTVTLPLR